MNIEMNIETWVYVVILVALSPFVIYVLASLNVFWTFLESGNIKYLYQGDTLYKIIADVRGKKFSNEPGEKYRLVDGHNEKTFWQRKFGLYWVGIWPYATVRKFAIKKRKEQEETAGKPMSEWIRNLGVTTVDSLRAAFPRPFLFAKVELGDRQTVDLLVVGKFRVVDTYIPVVELKGEFFELTSSTLGGAIVDILEKVPILDDFKNAPKGEENGILKPLTDANGAFNQALEKRVGLHLTGITIPEWDPSDPKVLEAWNKKFISEKEGEATVATAEAYKKKLFLETEADSARIRVLGSADAERVQKAVVAMGALGGSVDVATRGAADFLEMKEATSPTSKLTTLVKGSGAQPVVPVGEKP